MDRPDVRRAAEQQDHALDRRSDGPGGGRQHQLGAARLAGASGFSRICVRQFKLSNDPEFVDKLRDVVGLYVDPTAPAVVLSVNEKSPRSHAARPAHEEGPRRNHDP